MTILQSAFLSIGLAAVLLALVLHQVSKKFHVQENQRVKEIHAMLPNVNCGACGFAGCFGLADALVDAAAKGDITGLYCPPGGAETMGKIGAFLNLEVKNKERKMAVLKCGGSCQASPSKQRYQGPPSCAVANGLFAGEGGCAFGCLGQGDCVAVCAFEAMHMNPETGLPEIDPGKCTACGACVKACPRTLFKLRPFGPEGRRVWVNCRNTERGAPALKNCSAACIACGKCERICRAIAQAITVENNLATIDPAKCTTCGVCVPACPTGAIRASFRIEVKPKAAAAEGPA
jgi:Na+-translocating ferredoxin:NAD+ oxidoreductase subunit B